VKVLTLRVDYTYTEATDDVLHQELLRRPKNKVTFIAAWQATPAWQLNLDVDSVGDWVDVSRDGFTSGLQAPGYTTVNLATTYELGPHLALLGRINNLFDRHYENPLGFLQPSIGAYAGFKVKL
jgi:vitamin B12 transporter